MDAGVAAVAVAGISSVIGPGLLHVLNRRDLGRRIGSPNGQGNVTEIAERVEDKVDHLTDRVTGLEGRMAGVESRVGKVEQCAKATRSAVDRIQPKENE